MIIPKGFTAEFDAEFFSSPVGGYLLAEKEDRYFPGSCTAETIT